MAQRIGTNTNAIRSEREPVFRETSDALEKLQQYCDENKSAIDSISATLGSVIDDTLVTINGAVVNY